MRCRKKPNADIQSGTGLVLHRLIPRSEIPIKECFFTNVLFGVRLGKINTGRSPGWNSQDFLKRCTNALRLQIDVIQPCAIICLGRAAPKLLVRIFDQCQLWIGKTYKDIDESGQQLITLARRVGSVSTLGQSLKRKEGDRSLFSCYIALQKRSKKIQRSLSGETNGEKDQKDREYSA
jgi:hypothetical protein